MGRVGFLLAFIRTLRNGTNVSDVQVDRGGKDNRTPEHFSAPGDDAYPLAGDYVALLSQTGTGRESVVGYIDPKNLQKANVGDKRIYARDANTGDQIVELWLKNDGTAIMYNDNGIVTLQPDGEVNINGARITINGDVITAKGVSLNYHYHEQGNDNDGDGQVATEIPTPTE